MRCIGDKKRIANHITSYINSYIYLNNITTYIEPFVGGANIIDKVICQNKIGYDNDKYLIALYKHIQFSYCSDIPLEIGAEQYIDCKEHFKNKDNKYKDWYTGIVYYLASSNLSVEMFNKNSTCDSMAYVKYREELLEQFKYLQSIEFRFADYREIESADSLLYLDPPLFKGVNYDSITKRFNYIEFWNKAREWSQNNIVLISSKQAPDDFIEVWRDDIDCNSKNLEKLYIHTKYKSTIEEDIDMF